MSTKAIATAMRLFPQDVRKFWWWWEQLYHRIDGGGFEDNPEVDLKWPGGLQDPIRTKRFGYKVRLNLQLWPDRRTYFSGSYYQNEFEHLFPIVLRPGDQYMDIGANIGMTALMASTIIGNSGKGFAFEPNPETFARLKENFELNHVTNLELVPYAIAETESEAELCLPAEGNTGIGSLAIKPEEGGRRFTVHTVTGQTYLDRLDRTRPTLFKIDVEGYEVKVLKGIEASLDWPEIGLIAEVNDEMLKRAGDSVEQLDEMLQGHGFQPYKVNLSRERLSRPLKITGPIPIREAIADHWRDMLFLKPESKFYRERIAPLVTAPNRRVETAMAATH